MLVGRLDCYYNQKKKKERKGKRSVGLKHVYLVFKKAGNEGSKVEINYICILFQS